MISLSIGCGKKTQDSNPQTENVVTSGSESSLLEEGHLELLKAIEDNEEELFRNILSRRILLDLNKIVDKKETLLTLAVKLNRFEMAQMLIENNASIYIPNAHKQSPLMVASQSGNDLLVRLLVSLGAKLDNKDLDGNTALHLALLSKFENIALYLINSGANIEITNNDNQTALKLAEKHELTAVTNLIRSLHQSTLGLPDKMTVRNLLTFGDIEVLKQLFKKYPALIHDYKGLNFYVLVLRTHHHDKALSIIQLLINQGADIDGPAQAESTGLIEAVSRNYEDLVGLFLKENANPNLIDKSGKTALVWAIEKNLPKLVKQLLDKNALKKYTHSQSGKKTTVKACTVARDVRRNLSQDEARETNEEILELLGCGLRWLF